MEPQDQPQNEDAIEANEATQQAAQQAAQQGADEDTIEAAQHGDQDELAELKTAVERMKEDRLREQADIDNQRKRMAREMDNARKFANERLLKELLPVLDSLEASLKAEGDAANIREGVALTLKEMLRVVGAHGLQAVEAEGARFNPELHEAVQTIEQPGVDSETVVTAFQKGYILNERLIRPAMVVVAK